MDPTALIVAPGRYASAASRLLTEPPLITIAEMQMLVQLYFVSL